MHVIEFVGAKVRLMTCVCYAAGNGAHCRARQTSSKVVHCAGSPFFKTVQEPEYVAEKTFYETLCHMTWCNMHVNNNL